MTNSVVLPVEHELKFSDEMVIMDPVPYVGDEKHNPHNEKFSTSDGTMLLDIPDVNP